ncbi:acyl-CoA dehydrogenase family protein [Gordonia phosphorivorans]|uniref:Acyl-CoA dehydrogenase family protein n=1 Tax=Gordonia phosphorivorans TaxID=1056982 RepID=A0ABV6H6Z1_9ACTN
MDFNPSEAAGDVGPLAADIAAAVSTADRVAELEAAAAPLDEQLWRELGSAGLLGLAAAPEVSGDDALGAEETVAVATALGRHLSRVPYGPHAVAAVPATSRYGSAALIDELVRPACTGEVIFSAAFEEDLGGAALGPTTSLTGGILSGVKVNVPYAAAANALLVNAMGPDGPVVAMVRTDATGVNLVATPSTGLLPTFTVEFDGVVVSDDDVLSGGAATVTHVADLLRLGVAADQTGAVSAALEATAEYAREREQFGRPIGSFQAVAQRLADGYIDAQGLALSTAQAAWLMSGQAECTDAEISGAVATAKFWADDAGHRVAHTAVHVHGGVGLDTSHPAHRYFLRAKANEFTYGSAPVVLDELGELIAAGALG